MGYVFIYEGPTWIDIVNWLTQWLRAPYYVVLLPVTRADGRHHQCYGRFRWWWMAWLTVQRHKKPYRFELPFEIIKTPKARAAVYWRALRWADMFTYNLVNW